MAKQTNWISSLRMLSSEGGGEARVIFFCFLLELEREILSFLSDGGVFFVFFFIFYF